MLPVFTTNGVDFSGGATLGYCPNYLQGVQSAEIFIVLSAASDPSLEPNALWEMGDSGAATAYPNALGEIVDDWGSVTSHAFAKTLPLTEFRLYNVRSTPSEWTAYLDNVRLYTTPTNRVRFPEVLKIGGGIVVKEIAIYSPALSEASRLTVANAIGSRHGLPWAPPPTSNPDGDPPGCDGCGSDIRLPGSPPPATVGPRPFLVTLFGEDEDHFGEFPFRGAVTSCSTQASLKKLLDTARAANLRVLPVLTPNAKIIVNGVFSFNAYKTQAETFRGFPFDEYLADKTLVGIYVVDEPYHKTRWGLSNGIPSATVDQMCAVWKGVAPKAMTFVRAAPSLLQRYTSWKFLDCAWCAYLSQRGDVNLYIQKEKQIAQQRGWRMFWGLNCINGGPTDPSNPLFFNRLGSREADPEAGGGAHYNMGPAAVRSYGTALCKETYSEGFSAWKWDDAYMALPGIKEAFADLARTLDNTFRNEPQTTSPTTTTTSTASQLTYFSFDGELGSLSPWDGPLVASGGGLVPALATDKAKAGVGSLKLELGPVAGESGISAVTALTSIPCGLTSQPPMSPGGRFTTGYYSFSCYVDAGFTTNTWNMILGWLTGGAQSPIGYVGLENWTNNGASRGGDLQVVFQLKNCGSGQYACPLVSGYRQDGGWYKMTSASPNGIVTFPKQQWVHLCAYYKATAQGGQVKIWQDATLIMNLTAPTMNTLGGSAGEPLANAAGDLVIQSMLSGGPSAETRRIYVDNFKVTNYQVLP